MSQSSTSTVKPDVTIDFGSIELVGSLHHDDQQRSLVLWTDEGPEKVSVSLASYGVTSEPGNVFIKDWSEHAGLTERLHKAGLVQPVHAIAVGPFSSTAYEVRVTL